MSILCDNFLNGLEEQPGDQPVRVFYPKLKVAFGKIKEHLSHDFNVDISAVKLEFLTENVTTIGPRSTPDKIQIHDTFLSMQWCLIHGALVKSGGFQKSYNFHLGNQILQYATGLTNAYSEWDRDKMPNPELHRRDEDYVFWFTNHFFWMGYNYILYHEFAHILLGHFNSNAKTLLEKELEADEFAWEIFLRRSRQYESRELHGVQTGTAFALASILFSTYAVEGLDHPDPHHRLERILRRMDLQGNDGCWIYAQLMMFEWAWKFGAHFRLYPLGKENRSMKEAFYQSLNYLDHVQKERSVRIPNMQINYSVGETVVLLATMRPVQIVSLKRNYGDYCTYNIRYSTGNVETISNEDFGYPDSKIVKQAEQWRNTMKELGEKSMSIGLDEENQLKCFFHTSQHYEMKLKYPEIKFRWEWGQPSY